MHPDVLRALAVQRSRDLREVVANQRQIEGRETAEGPGRPRLRWRHRISAFRRATDPSPLRITLPAVATAPEPTSMGLSAAAPATVLTRHDRMERNAS